MIFPDPFAGRNIALRLATPEDAEFILSLRLDETLNRYLSKTDADVVKQRAWLTAYKGREERGEEFYFIIQSLTGHPAGTIRIYDRQGDSFCWGSWIVKPGAPPHAAMESALLVYEIGFGHLGFKRCHFDVRKDNARVVAFHERFGAKRVREDDLNYYFEFSLEAYELARERYKK